MDDDARDIELSTISAIYPEVQLDDNDPHRFSIELPVTLSRPLTVLFPDVAGAAAQAPATQAAAVDSQALSNLPALRVDITLPDGYPQDQPLDVTISTLPPWLSDDMLRSLEANATKLWEDIGRDQVIFTYIDDLQRAAEDVFGMVNSNGALEVTPEHKIALLDYDGNAKRLAFEKETFECGICLDPKKGIVCHKMLDCGHVFCNQCLQDFYNNAITEGNVAAVTCLAPNCAHERQKDTAKENGRKLKTFISPSELLQIPIDQDMVKRYVTLKHKNKLESDKNTIYCPRSWCQGAARSKRHKKPEGLEVVESDDEEDEDMGLLAICEDCGFAFCSRCYQGWHGEFNYCLPKERKEEISEEEKATLEYIKLHSTPCPTCWAPCQKSRGCNHMQCFRCETHFCYLCSAWLDPSNPYKHFNTAPSGEKTGCYMRLWELEGGDGDDVGLDYEGGDAMRDANLVAGQYGEHLERQPRDREEPRREVPQRAPIRREMPRPPPVAQQHEPNPQPMPERRAAVAREGPLVLRIEADPPAAPQRREDEPQQVVVANPRANAGPRGGHNRGNRRGGGAGANQRNDPIRANGPGRVANNRARGRRAQPAAVPDEHNNADINAEQAAWIRHFVALALNDEEDLVDWDSD